MGRLQKDLEARTGISADRQRLSLIPKGELCSTDHLGSFHLVPEDKTALSLSEVRNHQPIGPVVFTAPRSLYGNNRVLDTLLGDNKTAGAVKEKISREWHYPVSILKLCDKDDQEIPDQQKVAANEPLTLKFKWKGVPTIVHLLPDNRRLCLNMPRVATFADLSTKLPTVNQKSTYVFESAIVGHDQPLSRTLRNGGMIIPFFVAYRSEPINLRVNYLGTEYKVEIATAQTIEDLCILLRSLVAQKPDTRWLRSSPQKNARWWHQLSLKIFRDPLFHGSGKEGPPRHLIVPLLAERVPPQELVSMVLDYAETPPFIEQLVAHKAVAYQPTSRLIREFITKDTLLQAAPDVFPLTVLFENGLGTLELSCGYLHGCDVVWDQCAAWLSTDVHEVQLVVKDAPLYAPPMRYEKRLLDCGLRPGSVVLASRAPVHTLVFILFHFYVSLIFTSPCSLDRLPRRCPATSRASPERPSKNPRSPSASSSPPAPPLRLLRLRLPLPLRLRLHRPLRLRLRALLLGAGERWWTSRRTRKSTP